MKWIILLLVTGPMFCQAAVMPAGTIAAAAFSRLSIPLPCVSAADSVSPLLKSKTQFMEKYGTDDTSRALIRYYFFRGKGYRRFIWLPYVFATPFLVGGLIILSREPYKDYNSESTNDDLRLLVALLLVIGSLGIALGWSVSSTIRYRKFRTKLTQALRQYRQTGKVKGRIAYSTLFRVALMGEPAIAPWNQPKPAPRAPRRTK